MKMLTRAFAVVALSLTAAACGQAGADDLGSADDSVSAREAIGPFAGTWHPTSGAVTKACPGAAAVSEPVVVDLTWSRGADAASLVTGDLNDCQFQANVTGTTASAASDQRCAVSDGAYDFTTTSFVRYTFSVSADGRTATEERAGTIQYPDSGAAAACSFTGTAVYERTRS